MTDTIILKPVPESIKIARDFMVLIAGAWGIEDYLPRTVVSELVTNAVRHSSEHQFIVLRAYMNAGRKMIEVWDQSYDWPVINNPDETEEGGRGLLLLTSLVRRWGARPIPEGGKVVFAELKAS